MAKTEKKNQRSVGKPSFWVWHLCMLWLRPYYRVRYGVRIDRRAMRGQKGPCIVLAPHISTKDHFLVALAMHPMRGTFVVSQHLMAKGPVAFFLRLLHVIPKRMFCADPRTIMQIMRCVREGGNVVLFPEGRLPACGHSLPLAKGTADLLCRMGVDVYTITADGAYLTFPKWAKKHRRGRIQLRVEKLYDGETVKNTPKEQVEATLAKALYHDDELAMAGVRYACRDMTWGLEGLLRLCPDCRRWGTLKAGEGYIWCDCGMNAVLDNTYRLRGVPFERLNQWYDFQSLESLNRPAGLESAVTVGAVDENGKLVPDAGQGRMYLTQEAFVFCGQVWGKPLEFTLPTRSIGGFPVTVGSHFDLYYDNQMYHMHPEDPLSAIEWVVYLDEVHRVSAQAGDTERKKKDGKSEGL